MTNETTIMRDILIALSQIPGALFWRVNVGVAKTPDGRDAVRPARTSRHLRHCSGSSRRGRDQDAHRAAVNAAEAMADGRGTSRRVYLVARSVDEAVSALAALSSSESQP